jgi:hypothetical protein
MIQAIKNMMEIPITVKRPLIAFGFLNIQEGLVLSDMRKVIR